MIISYHHLPVMPVMRGYQICQDVTVFQLWKTGAREISLCPAADHCAWNLLPFHIHDQSRGGNQQTWY